MGLLCLRLSGVCRATRSGNSRGCARLGGFAETFPRGLYRYGTRWIYRAIPVDVLAEIKFRPSH